MSMDGDDAGREKVDEFLSMLRRQLLGARDVSIMCSRGSRKTTSATDAIASFEATDGYTHVIEVNGGASDKLVVDSDDYWPSRIRDGAHDE